MTRSIMQMPNCRQRPRPISRGLLNDILLASLTALASAGEVEAACRLAGQACAVFRRSDRKAWARYNALLHRLSRRDPRSPETPVDQAPHNFSVARLRADP